MNGENLEVAEGGPALNVLIEKMVYGGEGLARSAEGVLLVPLVLPGERVTVQPAARAKGVERARLMELLEPSADRVTADCPYFARCGGCQYQHIGYQRQLELKREILSECFERIGKIRLESLPELVPSDPWHYRNRSRLQARKEAGRFEIGYFELLSHTLCTVESCPISSPAIAETIVQLAHGAGELCFPEGEFEIELFASDSDQALMATVYTAVPPMNAFGDDLRRAIPAIETVSWKQEVGGRKGAKEGPNIAGWGSGWITYRAGDFHYRVGHESFFQTNRFLVRNLIDAALNGLQGKRALDLYAGVGLFTLPLAQRFEKVAAIESNVASAQDLETNVGVVQARAKSYRLTAEQFLATATPVWDAVLVDPPRSGLGKIVRENLCRLRPKQIAYVSCDPTTLARDVAALLKGGYRIRSVQLIDQFPQTYHIESVVHLEMA